MALPSNRPRSASDKPSDPARPEPPPLPSLGRYRLRRVLGRGGTGVVYEAYDTRDEAVVALKTIDADARDLAEHLYRLKHEFRALADVQHENLVRLGELTYEEGRWFFTMEIVRGRDFLDYVRPGLLTPPQETRIQPASEVPATASADAPRSHRTASRLDEGRLRGALAQLVKAVSAIHAAGHVHRDLKPSNVLVAENGRVVVLDFGLVTALSAVQSSDELVGTPAYMAPEQGEGASVGIAADWYAVGVMLFAALTGALPFEGASLAIIQAKITREAPSPLALAPDAPLDLARLCADLLRTNPDERATGEEVRARLGLANDSAKTHVAESLPPFVGREKELSALERAFADVREGRRRMVVLEGEPGIGKSSLVQRFLDGLPPSARAFSGRCYEQESVPFKGIDAMVDALSESLLDQPDPDELLRGGVRYLATVFPVLNRVPGVAAATSKQRKIDNPTLLREQAFGELERLFAALARTSTIVLYLDDLQWADRGTLALLGWLSRAEAAPLLLVATMRTGIELSAETLALLSRAERIPIGGLSPSESRQLCHALATDAEAAPTEAHDALASESAGHPLFLAELLRASRGGVSPIARGPARLQEVLHARIRERDPLERRFLELLAIAGAPTPYRAIALAAGLDVGECQNRLGALRAAQLIRITRREQERLVEPYHDRITESLLLHRVGGTDGQLARANDHLRLARALLEVTPPGELATRVFSIAQHLNAGRSVLEARAERIHAAEINLLACREAQLTTHYDRAGEHARIGLELLGDEGFRDAYTVTRELSIERARAELLAGDEEAAGSSFDAARARITDAADRAALYIAWIELHANLGHFARAIELGRERLRELDASPPRRITTLTLLTQYLRTRLAQGSRAIDELVTLQTSDDVARASAMRVLMAIAPSAFWVDTNLVGWISLEITAQSMRHGICDASSFGFAGYGVVLAGAFGKYAEAEAFGRAALTLNERFRNGALRARLLQLHGEFLAGWVRPLSEAKALLQEGYDRALKEGETAYEAFAACSLSHVSMLEGADLARSQAVSEWAREVCIRRKDRNMAGSVEAHARYAATLRGERPFEAGAPQVDAEFRALAGDAANAPGAHYAFWSCGAWLAYFFGDAASAEASLAEARRLAQANFGNPGTVDLCFLEALVGAALHDGAPWARRVGLRRMVARRVAKLRGWAALCPSNFEDHFLIARGELERITGNRGEARKTFARSAESARGNGSGLREALALERATAVAEAGEVAAGRAAAAAAFERCGANGAARHVLRG